MDVKDELITKIKSKKELKGLAYSIVSESLENYLIKNKLSLSSLSPSDLKQVIKDIRAELRKYVGRFHQSGKNQKTMLEERDYSSLISSHSSTKERIQDYEKINNIIYKINPKSILDIGCGINPLFMKHPNAFYTALDINESNLELVDAFFKKEKISGKTIIYDLRKISGDLPKVDLCIIIKVFDVIENKGHKLAEKILNNIDANKFIIGFSTKTLSGRPMNHPQRGWIEQLLSRLGYSYTLIKLKSEILYIAEKKL